MSASHSTTFAGSVAPFIQLTRLDKPTGVVNIALPYLLGVLYAGCATNAPLDLVFARLVALSVIGLVLRSAGCAWNDIVDRDLDKKVERCRNRPMARGAITVPSALVFTASLFLAYLAMFATQVEGHLRYTTILTALVLYYPFAKRTTNLAQMVLGLTLSWGIFIGAATCGLDILRADLSVNQNRGLLALFVTYTVWSVIHDTIYAQQDVKDDVKAGVRSMAVLFQRHLTPLLLVLSGAQVVLLAIIGATLEAAWIYYIPVCLGTTLMMAAVLLNLDPADAQKCGKIFRQSSLAFACCTLSGFASQYMLSYTMP